ncbi:MAG: glycosyltransferase family 39 protein [Candidatus Methylacidiphilales bacterium]|nr:glycosyltransferase family 39 protein [Candidatus Methylacidiphilales bacterium]
MSAPGYRKRLTALLIGLLLFRFWLGQSFELTAREAYIWLLSEGPYFSATYLNQGPLTPWLTALGTLLFGDTVLGVRWLAAVIYCGSGFLIFYGARRWFGVDVAFWCVVAFICMPLYAWKLTLMGNAVVSLGLMTLAMFTYREAVSTGRIHWWASAGLVTGLSLLVSPYNGMWGVGLLLFLAIEPKHVRLFTKPGPYLFLGCTGLIIAIAFALKLATGSPYSPLQWNSVSAEFGGVYNPKIFYRMEFWMMGPALTLGFLVALAFGWRQAVTQRRYSLFLLMSLPGILLQNLLALWKSGDVELMPALCLPLLLLAVNLWVHLAERRKLWVNLGFVLLVLAAAQSITGMIPTTGKDLNSGLFNRYSWKQLAIKVRQEGISRGLYNQCFASDPAIASALSFYLQSDAGLKPIYTPQDPGNPHTVFDLQRLEREPNTDAIYISRKGRGVDFPWLQKQYKEITPFTDDLPPDFSDEQAEFELYSCRSPMRVNIPID